MSNLKELLLNKIVEKIVDESPNNDPKNSDSIFSGYLGKRVIVRTYSSGVFYAILKDFKGENAILDDSRRIWKWVGASELTDLAVNGIKNKSESKISIPLDRRLVLKVVEVLPCTKKCIENIDSIPNWSENE